MTITVLDMIVTVSKKKLYGDDKCLPFNNVLLAVVVPILVSVA
jgi:hypothetical protein